MDNPRTARAKRIEAGTVLLAAVTFFTLTCAIAQTRLFWYDEIFTRQVVQLGSWKRIVAALHNGIDLQPPIFYFLTAWTRYIGGEEVGLRLPAILGFTFAGFFLYVIARRWFSPGYAAGVAVTPSILFFGQLGTEARPYGLVLGCAALALLGWTYRDRWPRAGRTGYIAGILGAAAAHYYGFTIAVPFGAAAACTLWRKRQWDLWTILGCVCAILPNLWNLLLIHEAIAIYKNGAWNRPNWPALATSLYGWSLAVLAAMFLAYLLLRPVSPEESLPDGECLACWAGFSAVPIIAMFMAQAISGMFVLLYFSMYSLGYGLLLAYLLAASAKGSRRVGYAAGCGALLAFACVAGLSERRFETERDNVLLQCADFTGILDRPEYRESHVLVGDPHLALQLSQYCDEVHNRIVFGADPVHALLYHGNSTDNKAMLRLRESPPFTIEPLDELLGAERHELVVFDSRSSILKAYLSHEPEYASRLHLLQDGETFAILRLDPAMPSGANGDGGK
jgi:hypothetical protein